MDTDKILLDRPIPSLTFSQLQKFSLDSIKAKKIGKFDPKDVVQIIKQNNGKKVIAVDIGGDKITSCIYEIKEGLFIQTEEPDVFQSEKGNGYLNFLKRIAQESVEQKLDVGISLAATVEGSKIVAGGSGIPKLLEGIKSEYDSDFSKLFSLVVVSNDGESGLIAGAVEAIKKYPESKHVIYIINGSGLNTAVLKDNEIWASETGHVKVDPKLNHFNQNLPCKMYRATYTCIELVGAGKAGIESIWYKQRQEKLGGREISAILQAGDSFAAELYDSSALITAHTLKGVSQIFDILTSHETVIVCHGGVFKVPSYSERVTQILEKDLGFAPNILFTKDFSDNACLDGAALAALKL